MRLLPTSLAVLAATQLDVSIAQSTSPSEETCIVLASKFPGKVSFPGSHQYFISNIYWSDRQAELQPACFITPESTEDVSITIKVLASFSTPFTVKSGGHTAFEGGSSIECGVTIDLVRLNKIALSDDRQTVSVGPGNRWVNISEALDPLGLAVVGGRVSDVGVSGLVLGGGISFFSGRYGWACDNVREFEIVLASGEVVIASPDTNADLFWALRGGGGSNFGIVTRFDLATFEQKDVWLYNSIYPLSSSTELVPAFVDLSVNGLPADPDGHSFFVMTHVSALGGHIIANYLYHAKPPQTPKDTPAIFSRSASISGSFINTTTIANVTTHSKAISERYGGRKAWAGTSIYLKEGSERLLQDLIPLYEDYANHLFAAAKNTNETATPFFVYQPITTNILKAMQKNGGNSLGLTPEKGPLVHIQITSNWETSRLDCVVEKGAADFIAKINGLAKERGLAAGYTYMNYADKNQDVYAGYGESNHERLKEIADTYDPEGILQRLWTGYFKV
ncbi:FAD binding domain-containing protein [Colletotrichum truncatum]|uniref:FAD binding domain-containing protein n=1 Tax=Colletotrichum truncatum TaxID=5467 RepID=A0ACC3ZL04_COLTU|nr:FAD binding domain-containing protein [Colletotrichum truncatum]KAF6786905.1 FAD binding domain-containing protein [Colletotrichum truncatum]